MVIDDYALKTGESLIALVVFLLVLLAVSLLRMLLRRSVLPRLIRASQAAKAAGAAATGTGTGTGSENTRSALALAIARNTSLLFVLVVAFYLAMASSGLAQGQFREWLWALLVVAVYLQLSIWANAAAVNHFRLQRSRKEREDPSAVTGYGLMLFFLRITIWAVVLISALTYFKYPVAGLIGALGVTGIAVAFAVQNILSDVFSSMAIILDKPFRVGDFIMADEILGVIEQIGVKTTRIRSLSGEQITLSNTNLLHTCIHNFKHMDERRVVFKLGVVYQTPPAKLERIPETINDIIRAQLYTRFDRAHFFEYGDFALAFEIVYYAVGPDYNRYMDIQQAINLAIYRSFQDQGIEFAYPTQELLIRRPTTRLLEQAS